ncbi:hypothetical protein TRVL_07161 [Trypanosoma vivax]|nr:hypothetical protein TRVL_07161 [Trypanosoma vivax]
MENSRKSRHLALRARGPLTLLRGIRGKEPSHGYFTSRPSGAGEASAHQRCCQLLSHACETARAFLPLVVPTVSLVTTRMPQFDAYRRLAVSSARTLSSPTCGFTVASSGSLALFSDVFLKGPAFFHQFLTAS